MSRLLNQVAVVTGAGSGIGQAIATKMAKEGAKIIVADLREDAAHETLNFIKQEGGEGLAVIADVTKTGEVSSMIEYAVREYGTVDILVNNAGAPMSFTPIEEVSEELWDLMMNVNAKGPYLGCKYAVPHMKKQGRGSIINIASIASKRARPGLNAYCASKGAVLLLTKALAIELAGAGIRVNAVNPGPADTPMLPKFFVNMDEESGRKIFEDSVPLGRMCKPEDIANMALYLASDEASFITGSIFDVDGGRGI
jgi:3-oxoacyl-[acyl-carrier protein] reductase